MILQRQGQNAEQNVEILEEIEDCSTILTTAGITIGTTLSMAMVGTTETITNGTTLTTDGTMAIETIASVGFGKLLIKKNYIFKN
jgi:hypothetical protein